MVDYLHQQSPTTQVLILAILPRGSDPGDMFKLPSAYSRAIDAVNDHLERHAFGNKHFHFADCAQPFTVGGKVWSAPLNQMCCDTVPTVPGDVSGFCSCSRTNVLLCVLLHHAVCNTTNTVYISSGCSAILPKTETECTALAA